MTREKACMSNSNYPTATRRIAILQILYKRTIIPCSTERKHLKKPFSLEKGQWLELDWIQVRSIPNSKAREIAANLEQVAEQ